MGKVVWLLIKLEIKHSDQIASGLKIDPTFTEALEGDIEKSHADISQAKEYFNWEPKIELRDWLTEILKK